MFTIILRKSQIILILQLWFEIGVLTKKIRFQSISSFKISATGGSDHCLLFLFHLNLSLENRSVIYFRLQKFQFSEENFVHWQNLFLVISVCAGQVVFIYFNEVHNTIDWILEILKRLVYDGISNEFRCLGAYYILASLTIVNQNAATALPWLYESVSYTWIGLNI